MGGEGTLGASSIKGPKGQASAHTPRPIIRAVAAHTPHTTHLRRTQTPGRLHLWAQALLQKHRMLAAVWWYW